MRRKSAKEMHVERPPGDRNILKGDIVVTAVGDHYAIGRLKADGKTQKFLGWRQNRAEALKQACDLARVNLAYSCTRRLAHPTIARSTAQRFQRSPERHERRPSFLRTTPT